MTTLPANPTGEQLVDAMRCAAIARGLSLNSFASALSEYPARWIRQTLAASHPKPHTVERVRALIAGERVPPPPPINIVRKRAAVMQYVEKGPDIGPDLVRVDRDPCPRCNVRRDFGCAHTARRLVAGYSSRGAIA